MWSTWSFGQRALVVAAAAAAVFVAPVLAAHLAHVVPVAAWAPWAGWASVARGGRAQQLWGFLLVAIAAGTWYLGWNAAPGARDAHGSARWRSPADFARTWGRWRVGAPQNPAGLVLGVAGGGRTVRSAWIKTGDGHHLLVGAPGSGKSWTLLLPTIGVIAESGENLVVTDPKGELYREAAGVLAASGYTVDRLDFRWPSRSVRWNPVTPIYRALAEQRLSDALRLARDLANLLTADQAPQSQNAGEFFRQSTLSLVQALTLAVAREAPPDARHVASVYATLALAQQGGGLDAWMDQLPPTDPVRQQYQPIRASGGETRQNQVTVALTALSLFADPNIAWLTAADEFDPLGLTEPRRALFIVVPDDSAAYYPLVALLLSQLYQVLSTAASAQASGRLPVPVHFLLDEFGNLPKIPDWDKALAVARGRSMRITLALQALAQLDARYGPELAKTMRNTCNTWVYLAANDIETARLISDRIGQTTIETAGRSWSRGGGPKQWSTNVQTTGRALLTPDEVARWKRGESLILEAQALPAHLPLRPFSDWPFPQGAAPLPPERPVTAPPVWTPPVPAGESPAAGSFEGFELLE